MLKMGNDMSSTHHSIDFYFLFHAIYNRPKDKMLLLKHNTDKRELLIEVTYVCNILLNYVFRKESHPIPYLG